MLEAFGDQPLAWFSKATMSEFRGLLCALPVNHHKGASTDSFYQIIEKADAEEEREIALAETKISKLNLDRGAREELLAGARVARLRVATIYRHLQAVQFIFKLAAEHGAAPHGLLKGIIWNSRQLKRLQAEEKDMHRLPWGDKLGELLATEAFTAAKASADTKTVIMWATLLGVTAGLRQEEALQLKTHDIDTVHSIPVIRVQSGDQQHLKSEAARRLIPIHDALLRLGFLNYVEECRKSNQSWLFPTVERCAAKGRLSGTFTKVFTEYRLKAGIYDPRRDFHSLRTHLNVELKRSDCPLDVRKKLLGHEIRDVTEAHYDPEGTPIHKFRDWVNMINVDTARMRSPWATSHKSSSNIVSLETRAANISH